MVSPDRRFKCHVWVLYIRKCRMYHPSTLMIFFTKFIWTLKSTHWVSRTRMIFFSKKNYVCGVVSNGDFLELLIVDFTSGLTKNICKLPAIEKWNKKKFFRICETQSAHSCYWCSSLVVEDSSLQTGGYGFNPVKQVTAYDGDVYLFTWNFLICYEFVENKWKTTPWTCETQRAYPWNYLNTIHSVSHYRLCDKLYILLEGICSLSCVFLGLSYWETLPQTRKSWYKTLGSARPTHTSLWFF